MANKFWTDKRLEEVNALLHLPNRDIARVLSKTFGRTVTAAAIEHVLKKYPISRTPAQIRTARLPGCIRGGRNAMKGADHSGENNPNWKGGISTDHYRYKRRQMQRYPEKHSARKTLYDAIRTGAVSRKPCEVCGKPNTDAHHDDYSRPLDVRWLCREHHKSLHMEDGTWGHGPIAEQ